MKESILHLTLKKKWFDMISSGNKKEEYREVKPYWGRRFSSHWCKAVKTKCKPPFKTFDYVIFKNGYQKNAPEIKLRFLGLKLGFANPYWSDGFLDECFVISLGEKIENDTTKQNKDTK